MIHPELVAALTTQLRTIVDKPLTAETLRELESTTRAARQLFLALMLPDMIPASKTAGITAYPPGELVADGFADNPSFVTATPTAETFGAQMIRELVSGLNKKDPPRKQNVGYEIDCLTRAYRSAEEAGLREEAARLRKRINVVLDVDDDIAEYEDGDDADDELRYGAGDASNGGPV